jgi:hypothetical protein
MAAVDVEGDARVIIDPAYRLVNRIISVLMAIIVIAGLVILGLLGAYFYAIFNDKGAALVDIERQMNAIWANLTPIASSVLRVVAPIIIVLLSFILIRILSRTGATSFNLGAVTSDLPSMLALIIVITICLLPLAGLDVPSVLNNIALVVVGFYFGKRETGAST